MTRCTHVPEKKTKSDREIWFINNEDLVLYRVINDYEETVIPLRSKSATKFICVDKKEFDRMVDDWVE